MPDAQAALLQGWPISAALTSALALLALMGVSLRVALINRLEAPGLFQGDLYGQSATAIAIFSFLGTIAMLAIPVHVFVNLSIHLLDRSIGDVFEIYSDFGISRLLSTIATLVVAPIFFGRLLLWVLSGGFVGGIFPVAPEPPEISGIPQGAETLRIRASSVDNFRFPDLGYTCFGACLITLWGGLYYATPGQSRVFVVILSMMGWMLFYIIDDYTILSQIYLALEKRVPSSVAVWRLYLVLVLSAFSCATALCMNLWFGLAVMVLTVPGAFWIYVLISELQTSRMSFEEFCRNNPGFARKVLYDVSAAVVASVPANQRGRATDAQRLLNKLAEDVALREIELQSRNLLGRTRQQSGASQDNRAK